MDTIGIRQLRSELAHRVEAAAAGRPLTVSHHGKPVAVLAPLWFGARELDVLLASGAITEPRRTDPWRPPAPVSVAVGTRIDQALRLVRG